MRSFLLFCCFLLVPAAPTLAQRYDYDAAGRLTTATYPSGASIDYEYDINSNITRIRYASATVSLLPPEGVIDTPANNVTVNAGESVSFTSTGSDADGAFPLTYRWDFGGGPADSTDEDPGAVTFPVAGSYTVTLTVTDATNLPDPTPDTVVVTVNTTPAPGGGGNSGGGGSLFLLPLIFAMLLLLRRRTQLFAALLVIAGGANAQSWAPMNSGTTANLNDVWAAAPEVAYAVGDTGTVLFFDGASWSPVDIGTTVKLNAVWGVAHNDIYVVGDDGFAAHFDGQSWSTVDIGAGSIDLTDVWYTGGGSVHVVGLLATFSNDGSGWTRRFVDTFRDGNTNTPDHAFTAVMGVEDRVLMTANPAFATRPGLFIDYSQADVWDTNDVWIFDANNMIVVGPQSRLLKNGDPSVTGTWNVIGIMERPLSVWGSASDNIYAVGEIGNLGRISHYDGNAGNSWTTELDVQFRTFNGIHGPDDSSIFAVGTVGMIYRYSTPNAEPTTAKLPYADIAENNVNTYTGELVYEIRDFAIGNGRHPLQFNRYYASLLSAQQTVGGDIGENWTHSFSWRIDPSFGATGDQVRVTSYRGREYVFEPLAQGYSLALPAWANASLGETTDHYLFADLDDEKIYAFRKLNGDLEWIEDRNGNRHTLNYNLGFLASVNNGSDQIAFEYDSANRITRVYAPGPGTVLETRFSYTDGRLATAISPSNVQTTYAYSNGAFLTAIDRDGVTSKTWAYDSDARVATTDLTGGGDFNYTYDTGNTTVTEPGGTSRDIFYDSEGRVTSIENGVGATTSYDYDANGNRDRLVDPIGRVTNWSYDSASGRIAMLTQPGGFTTEFDYSAGSSLAGIAFYDLTEVQYPGNAVENYEYDNNGNVVVYADSLDNRWDFVYDASGELIEMVNPAGGPTTITRSVDGGVETTTDPNNNTTRYRYDDFQRLTRAEYADGAVATLEYSSRFVPDRLTHRSGSIVDYSFGVADQLQRIDRSDGYFEIYSYDAAGDITSVESADGLRTEYRYDAFRNINRVTAPDLTFEQFAYDAAGRLGRYVDAVGDTWDFEYAADDALTAVVRPDLDRFEIDYSGDSRSLPTLFSNDNERLQLTYDENGQIASSVDQSEQVSTMTRNLRGDITQVRNQPLNAVRIFGHDVLGNTIRSTDPLGAIRSRGFDTAGLLGSKTDALGNTSDFVRDTLNRIETITHADGLSVDITYAASGQPERIQGSDGTNVVLDSSPEGRILGGTELVIGRSPGGRITESNGIDIGYDSNDRIATMTVAPGKTISYAYNGRGDVIEVRDWLGGVTNIVPTDVGKIDTVTYANGITSDYDYDRAERIVAISFGSIGSINIQRGVFGRIENVSHSWEQPSDIPTEDRRIVYDSASRIDGASYDARRNLVDDGRRGRVWNALDQLTQYEGDNGSVALSYDALGNIVRLTSVGQDRAFVHNYALENPRISIDRDAAGNDLWYYVHTTRGRLLYRINSGDERQYFHFDANGNTVFMTDDTGQVIQRYLIAPHGEVLVEFGNIENDRVSKAETGGMLLDDSDTLLFDARLSDSYSGHYLKDYQEHYPDDIRVSLQFEAGLGSSSFSGSTEQAQEEFPLDEVDYYNTPPPLSERRDAGRNTPAIDLRTALEALVSGDVPAHLSIAFILSQLATAAPNPSSGLTSRQDFTIGENGAELGIPFRLRPPTLLPSTGASSGLAIEAMPGTGQSPRQTPATDSVDSILKEVRRDLTIS